MNVLLIDNFDSFVYNLYQYLGELGCKVDIIRNNQINLEEIKKKNYSKIVISPGPGNPENERDFGKCKEVILELGKSIPVLGICLGHQGIANAFGGRVIKAQKPMHGKTSQINHNGNGLFKNIKNPLSIMRYHSLIADEFSLPSCLEIIARSTDDNVIMALRHKQFPIFGIQFHPESIMSEEGKQILKNFLDGAKDG
ncbi:MAG: aminodeoxychorismate/anthranilate synthase component II [Candidatus Micrarchaeota archaeon]